jgi:hypothetical protein
MRNNIKPRKIEQEEIQTKALNGKDDSRRNNAVSRSGSDSDINMPQTPL